MVQVTEREIRKAFRNHKNLLEKSGNTKSRSYNMVLFYAVECGLKALYMEKHKLRDTGQENSAKESVVTFKHDINSLLKKIKISPTIPKAMGVDNTQVETSQLHTAWRYGKQLDSQQERLCVEKLNRVFNELKKKLL